MNHMSKYKITLELTDNPKYYGRCNSVDKEIAICLPAFHQNPCKITYTKTKREDNMIYEISYTITHEMIHALQHEIGDDDYGFEQIVYYMVGNGHNSYFNRYYKIDRNMEWEKMIK